MIRLNPAAVTFGCEADLVERLVGMLRAAVTPFGGVSVTTEWNYNAGMTDVLAFSQCRELIAFEAKLRDWKSALHQAYRNTLFAHRAFVVMPANAALVALQHQDAFDQRGVGLIAVGPWGLHVLIEQEPNRDRPLMGWVQDRALAHFSSAGASDAANFRANARRHLSPA